MLKGGGARYETLMAKATLAFLTMWSGTIPTLRWQIRHRVQGRPTGTDAHRAKTTDDRERTHALHGNEDRPAGL